MKFDLDLDLISVQSWLISKTKFIVEMHFPVEQYKVGLIFQGTIISAQLQDEI